MLSVSSELIIGAWEIGFITTIWGEDAKLTQPLTVQVAEYVPADATIIELAVTPFDQITVPVQPLADNIAELPKQIDVFPEIVGALGTGFTVMFVEAKELSHAALKTHLKS